MREHRRWFQLRLTSLFLLALLVATFFAGYSLATRQAKAGKRREAQEAAKAYLKALPKRSERIKELYSLPAP